MEKELGISLAGGGIKAYAQIGVLKYLAELGISGTFFAGTSMGSIIAALLAGGIPITEVEATLLKIEEEIIEQKLFKFSNTQLLPLLKKDASGLISPEPFIELVKKHFEKYQLKTFADLKYPLVVPSVDLKSGQTVLFTNVENLNQRKYHIINDASLFIALQASCSFPLVFDTLRYQGLQLVDGGVSMNAPVLPLKEAGVSPILSITMGIISDYEATSNLIDIGNRVVELMILEADQLAINDADLNINVYEKDIKVFSLAKGKDAIDLGYKTALKYQTEILALTKRKKGWFR